MNITFKDPLAALLNESSIDDMMEIYEHNVQSLSLAFPELDTMSFEIVINQLLEEWTYRGSRWYTLVHKFTKQDTIDILDDIITPDRIPHKKFREILATHNLQHSIKLFDAKTNKYEKDKIIKNDLWAQQYRNDIDESMHKDICQLLGVESDFNPTQIARACLYPYAKVCNDVSATFRNQYDSLLRFYGKLSGKPLDEMALTYQEFLDGGGEPSQHIRDFMNNSNDRFRLVALFSEIIDIVSGYSYKIEQLMPMVNGEEITHDALTEWAETTLKHL